jgi:chromosome segregation ATPase
MVVIKKKENLLEDLDTLEDRMNNETLSLTEEKRLMKEKAGLEMSLPWADRFFEIKERLDEENKDKDVYIPRMNEINKLLDKLKEEITELSTEIDIQKDKRKEEYEKSRHDPPEVQAMRDKYIAEMDGYRKMISDLDDKYDNDLKAYDLQQCYIERVMWAVKQKKKLEGIEKAKERRAKMEEERKKREDEERALHHPYQKQMGKN